jgi:hypothetical protein
MSLTDQFAKKSDDLVNVAVGSLAQVRLWGDVVRAAGIEPRVVGDELTAGLGTAVPGSVELWVRREDAAASEAAIARANGLHPRESESHPPTPRRHPVSDLKPDRSRGPVHGAPPHRPIS